MKFHMGRAHEVGTVGRHSGVLLGAGSRGGLQCHLDGEEEAARGWGVSLFAARAREDVFSLRIPRDNFQRFVAREDEEYQQGHQEGADGFEECTGSRNVVHANG
jgi:hypothetical protein